jgi:4'-phosphopantetheinyl transferase
MEPTALLRLAGGGGDAQLWVLAEDSVDDVDGHLGGMHLLGEAEQRYLGRLALPGARRRFLGGRMLVRCALTAHTGLPLEQWSFRPGRYGRPQPLPVGSGISVNIAHTQGLVVCLAVRDAIGGVDTERTPLPPKTAASLALLLAEDERSWLADQPAGSRDAACAAVWVLKEAYLKATGVGLRRRVNSFTCLPDGAGGGLLHDPELLAAMRTRWRFVLRTRASGHVVAAALRTGKPTPAPAVLTEISLTDLLGLPAADHLTAGTPSETGQAS